MRTGTIAALAMFAALLAVLVAPAAHAEIIVDHVGQNNPTGESPAWSPFGSFTSTDHGSEMGKDYWSMRVMDNPDRYGYYKYGLTAGNLGSPDGWTATAIMRLVSARTNPLNTAFGVPDGSDWWGMSFIDGLGTAAAGVYAVTSLSSLGPLLSDVNPTLGYHTYQMVFDPDDDQITFYMDGLSLG